MSEKIILPDFIVADIYKNHLVEIIDDILVDEKILPKPLSEDFIEDDNKLSFLGENKKHVTVLVSEQNAPFINDNDLAFLSKILMACNLNLGDIAIINTITTSVTFSSIQEQLQPAQLLLIDVDPISIKLPFTMPEFQVQNFANCTILCAPALGLMLKNSAESKALKTKLWASLQTIFNLN